MRDNKKYIPYVKPSFEISENKEIVFDSLGNVKSIRRTDVKDIDRARLKLTFKRLLIFVIICAAIIEPYRFMTHFTPNKWDKEFMRPLIMENLKKQTIIDYNDKNQIKFNKDSEELLREENTTRENLLSVYDDRERPYNLHFRTPEKIREILGEPNPKNFKLPDMPQSTEKDKYEAYYCYGKETKAKWIILKYEYGLVYEVKYIE
ncbi:MAG: hypothetical protein RR552_04355 [Oscillospiraceae bacterium]